MKLMTVLSASALLLASINHVSAVPEADPAAVGADALLGRPLCFAATVLGTALFVVSLPVAATSHSIHSTANALVMAPARATFIRPLGDFDYPTPDQPMAKHHNKRIKRARHN